MVRIMRINGEVYPTLEVFPSMISVPDCVVARSNKIGSGNGEAKLYIASKDEMHEFYGREKFRAQCFMLKTDLVAYMEAIRNEYEHPSQEYAQKDQLPLLWKERMETILGLDDVIFFNVDDQYQISGPRGYIKSNDEGYKLIRTIALPLVSYIYVEKVGNISSPLFYWKLFVDFNAIWEKKNGSQIFARRKSAKDTETQSEGLSEPESTERLATTKIREGQEKYRQKLLEQCRFCPFTMISDERLLVASHIKPWAAANDIERVDPFNGYILSPMYDRLFDQGFITFNEDKQVILSEFISPYTWKQIGLENECYVKELPMDDKRIEYLDFHHKSVFKGSYNATEEIYAYDFLAEQLKVAEDEAEF